MLDATQRPHASPRPASPLPLPRIWPVRPSDVVALVALNGLIIIAMWVRHGGLDQLGSFAGQLTAIGQITALLGAYAVMLQLILMSRAPFLDQLFGMDRLAWYHRWLGFATLWLLVGHGILTTLGYALGAGSSVVAEFLTLITTYDYVCSGSPGWSASSLVAVSSVRAARRRLSYETWYGIHLYAYLGIALAFAHQLAVGPTSPTIPSPGCTGSGCTSRRSASSSLSGSASPSSPTCATASGWQASSGRGQAPSRSSSPAGGSIGSPSGRASISAGGS